MAVRHGAWTDERVDQIIGRLLQVGVALAAFVVLVGAVVYLARHGAEPIRYGVFRGEPARYRTFRGVLHEVRALGGRGLIQLGLLLLIATPVARVVFSVYAFARERDWLYVLVTLTVLGTLTYSLFWGRV